MALSSFFSAMFFFGQFSSVHLFFEHPHCQDETENRRQDQQDQINQVDLPVQEGQAGPIKEGSRRNGFNVRQHRIRVSGKGKKKAGQENDGHDHHGFDPSQVLGFVDQSTAEGAEAGKDNTTEEDKKKVT